MIHVNITIKGKVQKIGFRFLSMQTAIKLGINGYVRYLEKDVLYIEAEGLAEKIEEFKHWCRHGQCSYHISQITIEPGAMKHFTAYDIIEDIKKM
jgi:acylphosphatase